MKKIWDNQHKEGGGKREGRERGGGKRKGGEEGKKAREKERKEKTFGGTIRIISIADTNFRDTHLLIGHSSQTT